MKSYITVFYLFSNFLLSAQPSINVSKFKIDNLEDDQMIFTLFYSLDCNNCLTKPYQITIKNNYFSNLIDKIEGNIGDTIIIGKDKKILIYIKQQDTLTSDNEKKQMDSLFYFSENKENPFVIMFNNEKKENVVNQFKEDTTVFVKKTKNKPKNIIKYFNYDDTFFYELNINRLHSSYWRSQHINPYIRGTFNIPIGTNLFFCTELGYGNLKISSAGKEMTNNFFTSTIGLKYASFPSIRYKETLLAFYGNINAGLIAYNVKKLNFNSNQTIIQYSAVGDRTGGVVSFDVGLRFNIARELYINLTYNINFTYSRNFIIPLDNFNLVNQKMENVTFSSIGIGATFNPW